ncbi:MAG: alanine--tRNA ligase [Candidatus Komeilibacteria bacterium]|nr:alanine--tRNA ligase [Candidatus Komeilibacteria bacterium]
MRAGEIRKKYLEFFKEKGHAVIPSASLIPENDPSVLFTTAGMHPLVPFLLGEKHPAGKRLVSVQKCLRTGDIDEVGDNCHLTFFEMLGNWSLGDYWKEEAIKWSWEFLTDAKWLGLNPKKLAVTVFAGDEDCPFDEESYNLWRALGMPEARIARLDKDENWWPAGGNNPGPQGPDTEIFYWTALSAAPARFDPKDANWVEIWNNVFMQYNRTAMRNYEPLKQKNVDTGFGLERTAAALQGKDSIYEIELLAPLMDYLKSVAKNYNERSARIIVDHLRAAIFILADHSGIIPSNLKQGYVLRKLIRRAIRLAKKINIPLAVNLSDKIAEMVIDQLKDAYPELLKNKKKILTELDKEEKSFEKTLENGLKQFSKMAIDKKISGAEAFELYATYGFPLEIIQELAEEKGARVDEREFDLEMAKHQELSRTASSGMFKGGLANHSEQAVKYHTATHLLHQALRDVLGGAVEQKGSNINEERLRFDFSHAQKMTDEEIKKVEDIVNEKIKKGLPVVCEETTVSRAKERGAIGLFGDKYGEKVKVYSMGNYSKEICGGPHVEHLGVLGHFRIIKEEASSSGIRRIKAVLE